MKTTAEHIPAGVPVITKPLIMPPGLLRSRGEKDLQGARGLLAGAPGRVDRVELYRFDCTKPRHFSFGSWHNRQHVVVRLCSGGEGEAYGFGEMIAACNDPGYDVGRCAKPFASLVGLPLDEAFAAVRTGGEGWSATAREVAEMALLDLAGRLLGRPAIELLGLEGASPIPGLYCILDDTPERVAKEACEALAQGLRTHLKVKLFADPRKDAAVLRAAREVYGEAAYIVGDANGGYKPRSIDELADTLLGLHAAGLSGAEDPADMTVPQWVELQAKVGTLDLVPDAPVKDSARALRTLVPGMGRVYNIHPANTGSILDAVALGRKIQSLGAKLMIGDDSLIGPACTAWEQLAVGLGAAWVEAIEKPQECDTFLRCVTARATGRTEDGRFMITDPKPGFGLEVDEAAMRRLASSRLVLE